MPLAWLRLDGQTPDAGRGWWMAGFGRRKPMLACDTTSHAMRGACRRQILGVCERLPGFGRPVLVIWTPEGGVQRPGHGRRLAALLADAQLPGSPVAAC
jgi:hypothetical protein